MLTSLTAETLYIEGPDAIAFAHAQFSSNVTALGIGHWQFSAWLDPQGRVRSLFHLARIADDRLLLLLRGGSAATMTEALRRFVLRARLSLHAAPVRTLIDGAAHPLHEMGSIDDELIFGCGTHSMRAVEDAGESSQQWRLTQLREGWPWLPHSSLDRWLPEALSLLRLQAVAVDKGCYPGQEIVARLHYRGGHKWHLHNLSLSHPGQAGDTLLIDGREAGHLLDAIVVADGVEALAVLSDDAAAQAANGRLDVCKENFVLHLASRWPA